VLTHDSSLPQLVEHTYEAVHIVVARLDQQVERKGASDRGR
jgi:hypothetical protein